MTALLDNSPPLRSADEWRTLLAGLIPSLSTHVGIAFRATSWFVHDDKPGYASSCNCVDVRGTLNHALGLDACGVVCVTVNFGEAAWVTCSLLLFATGRRVAGPEGMDLISLSYDGELWSGGWVLDEFWEWQAYTDDSRWREA